MKKLGLLIIFFTSIIAAPFTERRKVATKVNRNIIDQQKKLGITPENIEKEPSALPEKDQKIIDAFIKENKNILQHLAFAPEAAYKNREVLIQKLQEDLALLKKLKGGYLGGTKFTRDNIEIPRSAYVIPVPQTDYILLLSGPVHKREAMNFALNNDWGTYLKENQKLIDTYQTVSHLIGYKHIAQALKNAEYGNPHSNKLLNLIPTYVVKINENSNNLEDKNAIIVKEFYNDQKIQPLINNLALFKDLSEQQIMDLYAFIKHQPWFWDIKNSLKVDITSKPPVLYYPDTQAPNNEGSYTYIGLVPKKQDDEGIITRKYEHNIKATLDQFIELLDAAYKAGSLKKEIFENILNKIKQEFGGNSNSWTYQDYGNQIDRDYNKFKPVEVAITQEEIKE